MTGTQQKVDQDQIGIWERLQIVVGEEGHEGYYTCRVTDIENDYLVINRPAFNYGHSLLAANRQIRVNFTRADAAYTFSATIVETVPKSPDEMLLIDLGETRRLQRRRFVRIDKVVPIRYLRLSKPIREMIKLTPRALHKSKTINISAGGLLMPADDDNIALNDLIVVDFTRSKLKTLKSSLLMVVRQVRRIEDYQQVVGLEFILDENLRLYLKKSELDCLPEKVKRFTLNIQNDLVSEMFYEQLVLRQKGLL